jgi:hypothetical protein
MKKTNIKTFRVLLVKDNMRANELAQLVKINGMLYMNRWGGWEASLPEKDKTKDITETALNEIAVYASAYIYHDSQHVEEHHDFSTHHPLDNFGFTIGDNNKLFIEKTALQNQKELIAQLQSELTGAKSEIESLKDRLNKISTWTGFDDVNKELIPKELDIALQVYSLAINDYNPETGKMNNGKTPKQWLINKINVDFNPNEEIDVKRIATVANWKKGPGRPKN